MKSTELRRTLLATLLAGAAAIASAQTAPPPAAAPPPGGGPAAAPAPPVAAPNPDAWKTMTDLPGVDMTGLSAQQKATALEILRSEGCLCGCSMKVGECRVKDPHCPASPALSTAIVQGVKDGKTPEAIKASLATVYSKPSPPPAPPPLSDKPVDIPTAGSPSKGEAGAKVTIVEFSDFQ